VDIRDNGSVDGDIVAPRVAIAEGAHFRGSVDMQRKGSQQQPAKGQSQAAAQQSAPPATPQAQAAAAQRVGA
jgi:cytoskeletal protein CcmA (bactofilin family)